MNGAHLSERSLEALGIITILVIGASFYLSAGRSAPPPIVPEIANPQFVLFAFDGSRSMDSIRKTLDFADDMQKQGKPIRFTYFVNAVHFIPDAVAKSYQP